MRWLHDGIDPSSSNRVRRLAFHVAADDYFITVATFLDALLELGRQESKDYKLLLEDLRDDLVYLQEHYRIVERREQIDEFVWMCVRGRIK